MRYFLAPGKYLAVQDGMADLDSAAWLTAGEVRLRELAGGAVGQGRGVALRIRLGSRRGVWRINRHGGWLGSLLADRYLSAARLADEIALAEALRLRGFPTPTVLLGLAVRRGGFWRQHLVTEEILDAETVFQARHSAEAQAAANALLVRLHEAGLWARDLHPANLLWQPATGTCYLIDLAGARLLGRPLRAAERRTRMQRFRRYFSKHAGAVPDAFSHDCA